MDGILNIYKEAGYTSHDVVAKLRGILKQKKIGHTGTLDPQATGVLPVCLGKGTRLCDLIGDWDKTYCCRLLLGVCTDTEDIFGRILEERPVSLPEERVREAILSFTGDYEQVPPMYSAKKVNGKKLYELAREGIVIERKPSPVKIYSIKILEMRLPRVVMEIRCSKGTYIRSLCRDIGEKLGVGGCMASLVRTGVSDFFLADSMTLHQVEEARDQGTLSCRLRPVDSVFLKYPALQVREEGRKLLHNGNPLLREYCQGTELFDRGMYRIYDDGHFIGLYTYDHRTDKIRPYKLFFL